MRKILWAPRWRRRPLASAGATLGAGVPHQGDGYKAHVPTLRARLFRSLGFRWPACPEDWERAGMAASYITVRTVIHLGFLDRLRVLVGGPAVLVAAVKTDVIVARAETRANVGVLPPGTK